MILYQAAAAPAVRPGELEVAGRRVAARAVPYSGEVGRAAFGFDPIERRFLRRRPEGTVLVGPTNPEQWRALLARPPAGPALVGPADPGEQIWGAYRAAAEGARLAGRGVYLLDPSLEGLPRETGEVFVALFCWSQEPAVAADPILAATNRGIRSGCLLPLIPGWTCARAEIERFVRSAAAAGARFVAPIIPSQDGVARRAAVEARTLLEPDSVEDFFGRIHHGDWAAELRNAQQRLREACAAVGLASFSPRPAGTSEPAGNAAAAGRLEEKAQAVAEDEHRASLLHAAARWIDESGRDLRSIAREGNFRKVFPFSTDLAREAEEALGSNEP